MRIGIIGGGIFGLASALALNDRGHQVCLFEQGTIPDPRASSTDVAKVIRRTGYSGPYLELVARAERQWRRWHRQLSRAIYYPTGKLDILRDFPRDGSHYQSWELLGGGDGGLQILSLDDARRRFPVFALRPSDTLLFDPWGGYLRSGQALRDLAGLARDGGVEIRENTPVRAVDPASAAIAAAADHRFDRAVVAAGPWTARLCPGLGRDLRVSRQQMAFFKPADPAPFTFPACPVWSVPGAAADWYGFPHLGEGLFKIADDIKGPTADPDTDRDATDDFLARARRFAGERLPALKDAAPAGGRSCLYTNTPDNDFVVDWVSDRVLVAGGGSGHGFKFGGAIGPVVADLIEDKANPLADALRVGDRFAPSA